MPDRRHILIVEDEHALGTALSTAVRRIGLIPHLAASGRAALEAWETQPWDALILDIGLPDLSGLEVLARIRARDTRTPVLVITAHATLDHAITAQKAGATLYLPKPLNLPQLETALQSLLQSHTEPVPTPVATPTQTATLIGSAPCLQPVFVGIARACASLVPTLISGPTGSGKTLAATIIHAHSRPSGPLTLIDGRQITSPDSLHLHLASVPGGGTLVIDDLTALPLSAQQALAAVLSDPSSAFSHRVLATTRVDPSPEHPSASLQPDLYYVLSASVITLPPLHARSSDIPTLSAFFLALHPASAALTTPALAALQSYPWPGNVRELRHALDYALPLAQDHRIFVSHLPPHIAAHTPNPLLPPITTELETTIHRWLDSHPAAPYDTLLDTLETALLRRLLDRHQGKVTHLATETGLNRATLRQKLRRLGLHRDDSTSDTHPDVTP